MTSYYNENDAYAAQWLRNLIKEGLIADGEVDTRSIVDVRGADLAGFEQCHFFAGIGGWSHALRLARWPDLRPVWTGSCPCQPFSLAGKQKGFDDERHLWPIWRDLIRECDPAIVFGEQVASASEWLGLVRSDLEAMGRAVGAAPIQAASAGADHLRDRYWFVAYADDAGSQGRRILPERAGQRSAGADGVADSDCVCGQVDQDARGSAHRNPARPIAGPGSIGDVADASGGRCGRSGEGQGQQPGRTEIERARYSSINLAQPHIGDQRGHAGDARGETSPSGGETWPPHGDAADGSCAGSLEWVIGADGKARRVKPGIRLLAHGVPNRVAKLRAFGNAIVPACAAEFIMAAAEAIGA